MPSDAFYSTRKWRMTRREHLYENPWCAVCAAIHIRTEATEVDHVFRKEDVDDPYDHANLRSLCKLHHSQKTLALDGTHRNKKGFTVAGEDGLPIPYREDRRT